MAMVAIDAKVHAVFLNGASCLKCPKRGRVQRGIEYPGKTFGYFVNYVLISGNYNYLAANGNLYFSGNNIPELEIVQNHF